MLKPIDPGSARRPQPQALPAEAVNNVFKVLHGFYGNLFLSKFATGAVFPEGHENAGEDKGIVSTRQVWAHGLREFDGATVKTALSQCKERYLEYPPNLPQFIALCAANKVRETFQTDLPVLTMSSELRSRYVADARQKLAKLRESEMHLKTGYIELPRTLDGLKRAVANAVACAGGDEAAALRHLDVMLAPRAAA